MSLTTSSLRTRRQALKFFPLASLAMIVACSPKQEQTVPPPLQEPGSPQPAPAPAPTPVPIATVLVPLDEKDPQAVALGYVAEAARADRVKFPNATPGNVCANCSLYLAGANDATGPCSIFPGKSVMAAGWCASWVKKA